MCTSAMSRHLEAIGYGYPEKIQLQTQGPGSLPPVITTLSDAEFGWWNCTSLAPRGEDRKDLELGSERKFQPVEG